MSIITMGKIKGGSGASLVATNLVVLRAMYGKKVLLVDADEQGSCLDFVSHRESLNIPTEWTTISLKGTNVRTEILKLKKNYDTIIIDCGGRDTGSLRAALTISDICIIPFAPRSFDIWTADRVADLIQEARIVNPNLKAYAFINQAGRGSDNEDAKKILSKIENIQLLDVQVGLRKAFSNAISEGLSVVELKNADNKAVCEIEDLYHAVFDKKNLKHKSI